MTTETDSNGNDAEFDLDAEPDIPNDDDIDLEDTGVFDERVAPAPKRRRRWLIWLVLAVIVVALAGAAYWYVRGWLADRERTAGDTAVQALAAELDADRDRIAELEAQLAAGATERRRLQAALDARLGELDSDIDRRLQTADSLAPRIGNLETTLARMQGAAAGSQTRWLLAEAEYFLQIANAQLQLGRNPALASVALGQADDRLLQAADPALTPVRRAIASERRALDAIQGDDVEGATLTLASLANVVETLPLAPIAGADTDDDEAEEEQGAAARTWAAIRDATSNVIKVTPPDAAKPLLLAPNAEPLLRANLALQLQAARLALLRGNHTVFEQSLDDADAWIANYFDTDDAAVVGARETIGSVRDDVSGAPLPDISTSLRLLRQAQVLTESAPASIPGPAPGGQPAGPAGDDPGDLSDDPADVVSGDPSGDAQ